MTPEQLAADLQSAFLAEDCEEDGWMAAAILARIACDRTIAAHRRTAALDRIRAAGFGLVKRSQQVLRLIGEEDGR